jgi:hypothetical protein
LRALLVIDTNSSKLKESVAQDQKRMLGLLESCVPKNRLELKVLSGNEVTPEKILDYYRGLDTSDKETLLFYYAGHGLTEPNGRHLFPLQEGQAGKLYRDDLRQAMVSKGAGLVVILTDCCGNPVRLPPQNKKRDMFSPARKMHPVVRCLLFQHRGIVDITASTNNESWGDDNEGGIFTRTLARLLNSNLDQLAPDPKGFLSWKTFLPRLKRETDESFRQWKKNVKARGDNTPINQDSQKPYVFRLPQDTGPTLVKTYGVVSLLNDTDREISYEYRWSRGSRSVPWKTMAIKPKAPRHHAVELPDVDSEIPNLELKVADSDKVNTLQPQSWSGPGKPEWEHGKQYKLKELIEP